MELESLNFGWYDLWTAEKGKKKNHAAVVLQNNIFLLGGKDWCQVNCYAFFQNPESIVAL